MKIETYFPSAILSRFIREYKIVESQEAATNYVLPDTAIVLAFRFNMPLVNIGGFLRNPPGTLVTGISPSARNIAYPKGAKTLLILFREGGAAAFFRLPFYEIFGASISLEDLLPNDIVNEIESNLHEARTDQQRIMIVESFLLGILSNTDSDKLIAYAVQQIKKDKGQTNIRKLAGLLNISIDPFEKRFRKLTGTTPKHFSAIIKLRETIQMYPTVNKLTDLVYEMNYFDQSHFIKDFKRFTGKTPGEFFRNGAQKVW
ncbi:helix-turn-helix domain-containing protein [Mucilaginibacter sp. cycad4]|uniref:helix-turn-helix domain-containing protein n=1 Tax=Mucilaginibacter sp. cycad4 TaxID=3342096 RepID=UPI002AABEF52|nr:helix-turn-helix domain-containing protein [Mucilaginibacter gossypii]WPU97807.1 helix-turn-helix domain-containing protein [Mucilaginibacter gossypii]